MPARSLHIAWLGPAPAENGGVPGVATDLLEGLANLGHRIDCFFPSATVKIPERLEGIENITVTRGAMEWSWDSWYSRTRTRAFLSGMLARGAASLRLRRLIARRHREDPYELIYQFSSIETLAAPAMLRRRVPLVIHPETHSAGELRSLIAERALSMRCQSRARFALVAGILVVRSLVQRARIRHARLVVCISAVFRDHLVHDYGVPLEATVVVPNPVRLERFQAPDRAPGQPPTVLVLGRVVARKGVESVVALARLLRERGPSVRIRVVGGPSLWSDYTKLLDELPEENAEYVGAVPGSAIPLELTRGDILIQPSRYEPFGLTIAEALASGVPVLGTSEVGAIEQVSPTVSIVVAPGDVEAMASGIEELLARLSADPSGIRAAARAEAMRLFAPQVVCEQISAALEALVAGEPAPAGATATAPLSPSSAPGACGR